MEFERKRAKTREERLRERRLSKLERKEERLLEEKQPSFLSRKAAEMASPVIHKVKEKLPSKAEQTAQKSAELLQKAFEKSFDVVLEKGSSWIGKICGEEKKLRRYEVFSQKTLSSWELSKLGCEVAARASANMVFSSVQGGMMGALGIGLPDVPIFLAAVFKTLFEISLSFGYPYDTKQEQTYQMLLICAAVGEEAERKQAAVDANIVAQQIRMGTGICSVSFEEAKQRASKALCSAALMGKMVQGAPIIGVYGGFRNGVLLKQIGTVAAVKYQQRMLRER